MKNLLVALVAVAGCGGGSPPPTVAPTTALHCPAADTTAGKRIASLFIDGREIGSRLAAHRGEGEFPETFELDGPEPPAYAALEVSSIDLIEYARGMEAERKYRLCPGGVAFLVTTKKALRS